MTASESPINILVMYMGGVKHTIGSHHDRLGIWCIHYSV